MTEYVAQTTTGFVCDINFNQHKQSGRLGHVGLNSSVARCWLKNQPNVLKKQAQKTPN